MENIDKDCTALGGLFQTIVNDMRVRMSYSPYTQLISRHGGLEGYRPFLIWGAWG